VFLCMRLGSNVFAGGSACVCVCVLEEVFMCMSLCVKQCV